VSGSPPRIHSNVSAPSLVEKKAPHLGHRINVSLDDSFVVQAHPKQNKKRMVNRQNMITHRRMGMLPPFYVFIFTYYAKNLLINQWF
jgi:hypothetical protein